jgi:hypothetical protein
LKVQNIATPAWLCINTKNIQQKNPKTSETLNPSQTKHTRFQNFFHKRISSKNVLKLAKHLTPPKQNTQDFRFFFHKRISSKKVLKLAKHLTPPKQNIQDFRLFSQKSIQQKNPKTIKRFNPSQTKHTRFHHFVTKNHLAKES